MKTIKTLVMVIFVVLGTTLNVKANSEPKKKSNKVQVEIGNFLKNPSFRLEKELTAKVSFLINSDNEIVMLSVESESDLLESYIKSRLNYSKLTETKLENNKTYVIPVRLVKH